MRQPYIDSIKDGFVASLVTVASTGALMTLAPNVSRTLLAVGSGAFGVAAVTSHQHNRLKNQLRLNMANFLRQESSEIERNMILLRESVSDTVAESMADKCFITSTQCSPILEFQPNNGTSTGEETGEAKKENLSLELSSLAMPEPHQESDFVNPVLNTQSIVNWLHNRKIELVSHAVNTSPTGQALDRLAMYLGNHYSELKPLHHQIKRNISTGSRFKVSLADKSQREIQLCTQFCNRLDKLSLLSYYRYSRQEKVIYAASQKRSDIDEFFRGGWFERYVAQVVTTYLQEQQVEYQYLQNPTIIFESGDRFELDLLFLINDQPLWIECKATRDFNRHLKQYSRHREQLDIDKPRSLLVALDVKSRQADEVTDMWGITVTNQHDLIAKVRTVLEPAESTSVEDKVSPLFGQDFAKFLRQKRIYPLPQNRILVLEEFIKLVNASNKALTLHEIKASLAIVFQDHPQISRTRLQSVLRSILRTDCLQDGAGKRVSGFHTPIHHLTSTDVEWLDQQCVYQYAAIAIDHDPNYFDAPENRRAFELAIGRPSPSTEMIQKIQDSAA